MDDINETPNEAAPEPPAPTPRPRSRVVIRVARYAGIVILFAVAALLGTLSGVLFAYAGDLPQISALDDYKPNTITRIHARDGQVIGEFATERRVVIRYDDMAPVLRQAIIASEDGDFEQHFGLSISRILVTAIKDVLYNQRYGASTITQQVARMLFLQTEYMRGGVYARTGYAGLERKIKEAILAVQLEKRYTKREIFAFYANHVTLGHGAYGVEAAARLYFDKPAKELNLEEAATIAAIVQTPSRLSPFVNPDQTLRRRNDYVLTRMAAEGFITPEEADEARDRPLVVHGQPTPDPSIAPYFVEEVRKALEQKYGAEDLYQAGLRVETTLDVELQEAANAAVDRGLRRIDKRRSGYRKPTRNILTEGHAIETFTTDRWARPILAGDIVPALVVTAPDKGPATLRIGSSTVDLPPASFAWTRRTVASALFTPGDLIEVEVRALDGRDPTSVMLEQAPAMEAALLAIDNRTGQIRAMVGGFSFARRKFNMATQARRQVGSLFKPIVFTAAIDRGYTPTSVFIDEPVAFGGGDGQAVYSPQNYDRKFEGAITLRRALEQSRNIPAVKAMNELGPRDVVGYAKRFGLSGNYPPYLSVALGAVESTLTEMTSAYAAFPSQGVRPTPYSIVSISDRDGNVLQENRPEPREAIRADTAYVLTNLLRGVVQRGTAASAASLDWPLAGKTGTVDDNTDAWFIGFDPNITVGVWVGRTEKKPLGANETGSTAALPIWVDFMKAYIDLKGDRKNPPQFEAPGNIVFVTLDSGLNEAFINGTQPGGAAAVPAAVPEGVPLDAAPIAALPPSPPAAD
jgi:penicillin-binding protein 1A